MRIARPALALTAALLTGCATSEAAAPAAVPIEQPTPTPSVATPTPEAHNVGRAQTSSDDTGAWELTVLRYRQPFETNTPGLLDRKGYIYGGIEAKLCVTRNSGDPVSVSWAPWSLSYDSGIVVTSPSSWSPDGWDEPLYPMDHLVGVGRCARGWIPFEVPVGDKPATVHYQPGSGNALEWQIK